MKASDYIVNFLVEKGITDVFGYPGGMVTHLMESFDKYRNKITAHVNYHEQGAAFSACGYAQTAKMPGVAYATSGPGATNLITGIANAYFDSIPVIFITGQVNTYESKASYPMRQRGFQETDIVGIVKPITKYAVYIDNAENLATELEKAYSICMEGRKGPVLLDIPMNIQRAQVQGQFPINSRFHPTYPCEEIAMFIIEALKKAKRPVIIAGNGIKISDSVMVFRKLVNVLKLPVVTSMIAVDCMSRDSEYNYGFIGPYGHRYANFIVQNCDLILSFGSRMDSRQTGADRDKFAPNADIIRIDIDESELLFKVKKEEKDFLGDLNEIISYMIDNFSRIEFNKNSWLKICDMLKCELKNLDNDNNSISKIFNLIGQILPEDACITTDVGQNQVWVAQFLPLNERQMLLFSGGHGAMGYSLPAAIGAYYGLCRTIVSFNGDGGFQMNLQELQFIARERLPVKIVILNNKSLGMIRHFQEMYFEGNYVQTKESGGYCVPSFRRIAAAYDIKYICIEKENDISLCMESMNSGDPVLIEVKLSDTTYVYPKLSMGRPLQDQDKLMDRTLYNRLMELCKNV